MALVFIVGVILTWISINVEDSARTGGCSKALTHSVRGILVIGITFVVSALSFGVCRYKSTRASQGVPLMVYGGFVLILGIILTVLGSVIKSQADKGDNPDACKKAADRANWVIVMGVLMVVACIGYYLGPMVLASGKHHYKQYQQGRVRPSEGIEMTSRF